jgi:hypothetical protein
MAFTHSTIAAGQFGRIDKNVKTLGPSGDLRKITDAVSLVPRSFLAGNNQNLNQPAAAVRAYAQCIRQVPH